MSATYYSASKDAHMPIAEMAYPHIVNAIKKIEDGRDTTGVNNEETLAALKAELQSRDEQEQGPPPKEVHDADDAAGF